MIDLGQVYHATLTIVGQSSPPTSAVLVITLPDGTTDTPAVGSGAASGADWLLSYDYQTVQAGLHKAAWTVTGPGTAATDYFSVRSFISIISLAEAKDHLNITRATDDSELRRFMMASTELVESKAGMCVRRAFTDRVEGRWQWQIVLPRRPVLSVESVTSIWAGGMSWAGSQLDVDHEAGIVSQLVPPRLLPFWWGPWDVAYTVGRADVAEHTVHAAKEQLRHLWETQRGAQPPQLLAGEQVFTTAAGWSFSVPNRVLELLEPDMVPPS